MKPANNDQQGFTLLELTVVIVIIGLLAAFAYLFTTAKIIAARELEAKVYVGSVSHSQQAYFLEHQVFASNLLALELGLPAQSRYYSYTIVSKGVGPNARTMINAHPLDPKERGYRGCVSALDRGARTRFATEDLTTSQRLEGTPGQDAPICPP